MHIFNTFEKQESECCHFLELILLMVWWNEIFPGVVGTRYLTKCKYTLAAVAIKSPTTSNFLQYYLLLSTLTYTLAQLEFSKLLYQLNFKELNFEILAKNVKTNKTMFQVGTLALKCKRRISSSRSSPQNSLLLLLLFFSMCMILHSSSLLKVDWEISWKF